MTTRHTPGPWVGFRASDDDIAKLDEMAMAWGDASRGAVVRKAIRVLYELECKGGAE